MDQSGTRRGASPEGGARPPLRPRLPGASPEIASAALLAESEARFRMLAENASDIVYELSPEGSIAWISPSVEHLLGHAPEALVGLSAMVLIADEDHELVMALAERLRAGDDVEAVELRYLTAKGERRWMSVRARPFSEEGREFTGAVLGVRDCHAAVSYTHLTLPTN